MTTTDNERQINARMNEIAGEISALASPEELTGTQARKWAQLNKEFDELKEKRDQYDTVRAAIAGTRDDVMIDEPIDRSKLGYTRTPRSFDPIRTGVDEARRQVDDLHTRSRIGSAGAERITGLLGDPDEVERSRAAAWVVAAGSDAYLRAFAKIVADPTRGHLLWEDDEQQAFRDATRAHKMLESRALATSGYVLPVSLDPVIMLTNGGAINPLRDVARVVSTSMNTWRGITSAGATAEWKVEAAEASDGSPTVAETEIDVHAATVDVVWSYEVEQDADNLVQELGRVMRDAVNIHQLAAFTTGTGIGQPQGLITGLAAAAGSIVTGLGTEVLDVGDAYAVQNDLPARFSAGASWLSSIATRNTLARFETTNGAHEFPELRQTPPSLLGKPWAELSQMDGSLNAAATEANYLLAYGDWAKAFVIVDRVGSTIELLPGMGANGRPTGQRHAFLFSRVGSKVVVPNAGRVLNVPTTA